MNEHSIVSETTAPEAVEWWHGPDWLSASGIGERWSARANESGQFKGGWWVRDADGNTVASGRADDGDAAMLAAEKALRDLDLLGVYPVESNPPMRMPRFTHTPLVRVSVPWDHEGNYAAIDPNGKRWDLRAGQMLVWYSHSETVLDERTNPKMERCRLAFAAIAEAMQTPQGQRVLAAQAGE